MLQYIMQSSDFYRKNSNFTTNPTPSHYTPFKSSPSKSVNSKGGDHARRNTQKYETTKHVMLERGCLNSLRDVILRTLIE